MYKIYFKQAWKMLRQNLFISIVSIVGTAIAIMMIMAIVVSDEVKSVSVAPEVNRHRTYYIEIETKRDTATNSMWAGSLSYETVRDYLSELKVPQKTAIYNERKVIVRTTGMRNEATYSTKETDDEFWQIHSFTFVEGRPFSREEYESGIKCAILSESLSKELFKEESALNREVDIDFNTYRVMGVVKDVSPVFTHAHAKAWIPYTASPYFPDMICTLMMMLNSAKEYPALYAEIRETEQRFNSNKVPNTLFLKGPENQQTHSRQIWKYNIEEVEEEIKILNRKRMLIFLILLFVPAINLSGFSLSRIKKRISEIGVRKAFGAKKHVILIQVLYENLITSLIGGVLGLALSYFTVLEMREWLLGIPTNSPIPVSTLISPWVFLSVFLVCLLLNLLSAGIPAYRASRMSIINSLNQNDKRS